MRIALLAAFPFPLPQGSQVYVAEQARALARSGVDVTLLCYGHGLRDEAALAALRADGVSLSPAPASLSRTPLRAGPSLRKPVADAALLATLLAAQRWRPFEAILAHNGEAACIALAARALTKTPVVYVAHTLFGNELRAYAPAFAAGGASAFGRGLDRLLAQRADAVIAVSAAAATALGVAAPERVTLVPPAIAPAPAPPQAAVAAACRRHGLATRGFVVYAGNLDAYQDLGLLAEAARGFYPDEIVVVTHDPLRSGAPGLRLVRADSADEVRHLLFGAALAVVPRRIAGGFPIKLLNYMEAGLAIIAFEGVADGLTHGVDAWLLPQEAAASELAAAIRGLRADPSLCAQLGERARHLLETRFGWEAAIARTLDVVMPLAEARHARGRIRRRAGFEQVKVRRDA